MSVSNIWYIILVQEVTIWSHAQRNDLVHFADKSCMSSSWTLPQGRPVRSQAGIILSNLKSQPLTFCPLLSWNPPWIFLASIYQCETLFTANAHTRLLDKSGNTLRSFILFLTCMLTIFGLQGDLKKYQLHVVFMSKDFLNYLATQTKQQLTADEHAVVTIGTKLQWPCHTCGRKSRGPIIWMRSDLQLRHGFSNSHMAKVVHIFQLGEVHF